MDWALHHGTLWLGFCLTAEGDCQRSGRCEAAAGNPASSRGELGKTFSRRQQTTSLEDHTLNREDSKFFSGKSQIGNILGFAGHLVSAANVQLCSQSMKVVTKESVYLYPRKSLFRKSRALAGVAQWIEHGPAKQRVAGSIPSQGTCLGGGPGPR